jgi:hypothetical protein
MALSSSNAVKQLSDGNSQGTVLGQSSSDKIGFYGLTTPIAKASLAASSVINTAASSAGVGFVDAATASSIAQSIVFLKQIGLC